MLALVRRRRPTARAARDRTAAAAASARFEIGDRRGRRFGEQALDVVLERRHRRMLPLDLADGLRRRRRHAPGDRARRSANRSASGPRSVTFAWMRPVSSAMLRACTTSASPSSCSEPTTTCAAPTSWPMRITVASVSAAAGGTCRRSNACCRSLRVMALDAERRSDRRSAGPPPLRSARRCARRA